jgi:hypothetical protein
MSLPALRQYPRSAYPPIAQRIRKAPARTRPSARGWGELASTSKAQAAKNVRVVVRRSRDGKTWEPRCLPPAAPLAQLLFDITDYLGANAKDPADRFEFRGAQERQGGIGSYFMRDIRESDQPSWHSWNVAFDLMTKGSPRSFAWSSVIPPWMVELWEAAGFGWGGRWGNGKTSKYDPHHFEYRYRPGDISTDIENAKAAALRIARRLGVTLPTRFLPKGHVPDPEPAPEPAPPPEDDMPAVTTPLVGHEALVGDPAASTTVRSRPSPKADAVVRSFAKGQTETWTVVGWVTGEHSAFGNSDQWLARVAEDGSWEYTAKGNVRQVLPPAAAGRIAALELAAAEDLRAMHGAKQHMTAAEALLSERLR